MSHYGVVNKIYRVVISASGLGGAAPRDGFIDDQKSQYYARQDGDADLTAAQTSAKSRANSRYETLVWGVQNEFNVVISNIVRTGGSRSVAPTKFQFDLMPERGESVVRTRDENNAGEELVGVDAIKRIVARALMIGRQDRADYADDTSSNTAGSGQDNPNQGGQRRGSVIGDVDVGALATSLSAAESAVSVTEI